MEKQNFGALYNELDKAIMRTASNALNPRIDRVEELKLFAKEAKIKTIGIAHCTAVNAEAQQLEEELIASGFTVAKVNCKYGKVPFSDILEDHSGTSCNPAGQAQYLNDKGTELNLMLGLCVGHDMIFNKKSTAPVSTLIVKDRKYKHHTREHFFAK